MFDFLSEKFSGVLGWLKDKGRLTEDNIRDATTQVRTALLEADVPHQVVEDFLKQVHEEIIGRNIHKSLNPGQQLIKVVHDKVLDFLGGKNVAPFASFQIPSVIMVMGLQGAGKTTTIAKLAHFIQTQAQKRGKARRILLGSIDFYRPAAIDQLEILAKQVNVSFYRATSTDPVKAAQEIQDYFKQNSFEHLLLDTAGRLHIDEAMMNELKLVNAKLQPKYKFLILDAMTGQESLAVAQAFDKALGFDYAALSKMDSDTRGGAAFGFRYVLKKPIVFVGVGEKPEDLEAFVPERMTTRILGMGDIMTLIEKASDQISEQEQTSMTQKMLSGHFNLKDFAEQMSMLDRLGSLQKITRYLPGMGNVSPEVMEKGQVEMKRFRAIISSMTNKEKLVPSVIDASRRKRIAAGSGTTVQDINQLLQRFEQSREMIKMLKKNGMMRKFFK
jgi:signal recognition particle subunit SRP54